MRGTAWCARLRRAMTVVAVTATALSDLALVAPVPAVQATTAKSPLSGIVDRNGKPFSGWESVVNNYVVRVTWAELQTSSGGAITPNNDIDKAVTAVRTWNANHSPPEAIKVRVDAGTGAPDWAKNLGGPNTSVAVHDASAPNNPDTTTETVGRFWEDNFGAAYNDFESKLAALYDAVPEIRDVTISRCTLSTVEPFLRTASSPATKNNLLAAGYTVTADKACQTAQIDEAKAVWLQTPSSLALNPYQQINADGTDSTDESYTESMISYCRTTLGSLCVLANNSLRDPPQTGPHGEYTSMYNAIKAAGSPITFQTAGTANLGSLCNTLTTAVSLGANSVEIPGQYSSDPTITQAGLNAYDHALDRVQPPDTTAPSAPANLKATINSSSNVSLIWQTATDAGYGAACHTVKRNGAALGTTMATSFTDAGADTSTPTQYTVTANDGAGNVGPAAAFSIAPPITTISASPTTITYGSSVTFTATVTSQVGGTPTGIVKFLDGTTQFGSAALDSTGKAPFATSSLTAGSHSITAAYQGDPTFPPSNSSAITETVNKARSTTALTNIPSPSGYGSAVTLTATIAGPGGPPTGTVTFKDGSTPIGSPVTLDGAGQAQMTTNALAVGSHSLGAAYSGDGNLDASSTTHSQSVTRAGTSTALNSSANPADYGSPVTFTATVTSTGATPSGTVTFRNGRSALGTVGLDAGGAATLTSNALTKVSNSITATYGGSPNFLASTSPVLAQSLDNAPSTVSILSSRNPVTYPNLVTFTATVTSSAGTPTGPVDFYDGNGATLLGSAPITAGRAKLVMTTALAPGGHLITAHYNGDPNVAASTSKVLFQRVYRVGAVSSSTSLTSSPNPSSAGQPITITATVKGTGGPPTGTVWFFNNGNLIDSAPVDSAGRAAITTSSLPTGSGNYLTAGYSGDSRFNPSISASRRQTVNAPRAVQASAELVGPAPTNGVGGSPPEQSLPSTEAGREAEAPPAPVACVPSGRRHGGRPRRAGCAPTVRPGHRRGPRPAGRRRRI